jgi:ketosteroid isomerase-like protein
MAAGGSRQRHSAAVHAHRPVVLLACTDILDNGDDTVVALATHNGQRDADELAMPAVHVRHVKDGKATSHESFVADDRFWS